MNTHPIAKNWKILVVDNEPDNVSVAQMMLSYHGATVRSARHGVEGLAVLQEFTPTVVLLDLSMPVMDGWEMLEKVRANPATAHIPVIALTAHAAGVDQQEALAKGFDGFIVKPFRIDAMIADIQHCLERSARAQVALPVQP